MSARTAPVLDLHEICGSSVPVLLAAAGSAGLTVQADGDRLVVRGPKAATELGRELIVRKAEVLAHLARRLEWDTGAAVRRLTDADTLVGRLGVSGTNPAVAAAADRVCRAYAARDAAGLRAAVAGFEAAVRAAAPAGGQVTPGPPTIRAHDWSASGAGPSTGGG